ncbi:MAG: dTDP-4-dehydrorhamnose 3,5-epimerase family protein [Planctomycetes bacterium]|nr:dTDP-4-dehydrorhamnose 3,5-epimerase family protein [Planctomycetota bacterium]MCC7397242.1 dTDP-4-dehydrorhamnose 3,5-epimerase family protein [Planctomycetota bacterium]
MTVPRHPDSKIRINTKAEAAFSFQDYSPRPPIEGVVIVELRRFNDDGGSITELGRLAAGMHAQLPGFEVKQVNYSEMEPGAIKAFHMHHRQTDVWYVPPCDKLLLVLHDCRAGSPTEHQTMRFVLGDGKDRLVRIPPGVAHGARNIGQRTGRILYMVDVQFSVKPEDCDEGRLPWDHLGADIWELVRG